jgi:predicted nucleic acid-binding protein
MAYIDTNVLLSYYFTEDENHTCALNIVKKLRSEQREIIISPLTVAELFSVISRRIHQYKLPPHIKHLDEKTKVGVLVRQALSILNPRVIDDEPRLEQLNEFKAFHIFAKTVDLAHKLKLKALDLMHIAYTINLASKGLANTIVTLDKEIKEKEPVFQKLCLKVYDLTVCTQ